jgi:hypothetical protein
MNEEQERFKEIIDEMKWLLEEAYNLLPSDSSHGNCIPEAARSYWYASIKSNLSTDHEFLGGSMLTMEESLDDWKNDNVCFESRSHENEEGN